MKIGDVSEQLSIPASTIRYYERIGLLEQQQRISGKRVFDKQALNSLKFVQLAQNAGFTIDEMKLLLDSAAHSSPSSDHWRQIAKVKRRELQDKIEQLKKMDSVLSQIMNCKCSTLNECVDSCFRDQ
ncbi:MerR family transcriptional regulator [Granulosicoccus sp.]|nr:MerR family transcriptional regulator [Granulosicoccus sp.]